MSQHTFQGPVLLFDTGYLTFYRYHATARYLKMSQQIDKPSEEEVLKCLPKHLDDQLKKTIRKFKAKSVFFCHDAPGPTVWRFNLPGSENYKAGRVSSMNFQNVSDSMSDILTKYGINLRRDTLEADDIIALTVDAILACDPDTEIIIVTKDNDFLQLLKNPTVRIVDGALKENKGSCDPTFDLVYKILVGDKSDNIAPVCSPKIAKSLALDKAACEEYLRANPNKAALYERNSAMIDMSRIPNDLKLDFNKAYKFAKKIDIKTGK